MTSGSFSQPAESKHQPKMGTKNTVVKKFKKKSRSPMINEHPMTPTMERALEVQRNLPSEIPNDLRLMTKSHVSGGYWMGLSRDFCDKLPSEESILVVADHEEGTEYNVTYLPKKYGLSGGWRCFAINHSLKKGDVLIFQRIEPLKLKVYIFKESVTEVGGAMPMDADIHEEDAAISIPDNDKPTHDVDSGSESDISFSEDVLKFEDVKIFGDFKVQVDGIVYKSQMISKDVKQKYYELCRSQNMFLHESVTGYNIKLIAGMISETVNIADAVGRMKSTTSIEHMKKWDKTLKAFEELGMAVRFLRDQIHKLLNPSHQNLTLGLSQGYVKELKQ